MKTGKVTRCPENGGEMKTRKTEIAMGNCIKSDIERVGEKVGKNYRSNWRRLTENIVREK